MKPICLITIIWLSVHAMEQKDSKLLPNPNISLSAHEFIKLIDSRDWQTKWRAQIRLFKRLASWSNAECRCKMEQYRLAATDYHEAVQDPIVLQAWLANLDGDIRDVQAHRLYNEMCFSNKLDVLQQLERLGLCAQAFEPTFFKFLIQRAERHNYLELAAYLRELRK